MMLLRSENNQYRYLPRVGTVGTSLSNSLHPFRCPPKRGLSPRVPTVQCNPLAHLVEGNVLDESDAVDVEEDAHEGELYYCPGR